MWTNTDCQAAISEELPVIEDETTNLHVQHALVKARLLSSKVLAQEINNVVQLLRAIVGLEGKENVRETSEVSDTRDVGIATDSNQRSKAIRLEEESDDGSSATSEEAAVEGWTGFGDDDESDQHDKDENDIAETDEEGRAAEAAGWESGTVGDSDEDSDDNPSDEDRPGEGEDEDEDEKSGSDDELASMSSLDPGPSKKARPAKAKAGESSFLPSLSVGFVKGSDSEWSDAEADAADLPQKKNRRGQRARKAYVYSSSE